MRVLACDLGGTRVKAAVLEDGRLECLRVFPAATAVRGSLAAIGSALHALAEEAARTSAGRRPDGIVLGLPSIVDARTCRVLDEFGKYPELVGVDLEAWAREEFGLPLAVENDARLAAIGEWRRGAGAGAEDLVMVTLGTGIGSGVILGGKPLRGAHGQAGCLGGHLSLDPAGAPCACGNLGCAETLASGSALDRLARSQPGFAESPLARLGRVDYEALFATRGDPVAEALVEASLLVWGAAAVNLVHAYDPELLVFGGGIMKSAERILPALRAHVEAHAHGAWGRVRISAAALGDAAALHGAEWLLAEKLEGQP